MFIGAGPARGLGSVYDDNFGRHRPASLTNHRSLSEVPLSAIRDAHPFRGFSATPLSRARLCATGDRLRNPADAMSEQHQSTLTSVVGGQERITAGSGLQPIVRRTDSRPRRDTGSNVTANQVAPVCCPLQEVCSGIVSGCGIIQRDSFTIRNRPTTSTVGPQRLSRACTPKS